MKGLKIRALVSPSPFIPEMTAEPLEKLGTKQVNPISLSSPSSRWQPTLPSTPWGEFCLGRISVPAKGKVVTGENRFHYQCGCIPGTQIADPLDGKQTVDPLDQWDCVLEWNCRAGLHTKVWYPLSSVSDKFGIWWVWYLISLVYDIFGIW